MKPSRSNQRSRALTLIEVLVVIAILFVVAALLLPAHVNRNHRSPRISCVNNLKQIGLSYRLWEGDNGGKYPMDVSVTNGGTMGLANGRNAWINFFVMSNQLSTPKILHCQSDTDKFAAANFSAGFDNRSVSYFVGLDAHENDPQAILSGDDNFEIRNFSQCANCLDGRTSQICWQHWSCRRLRSISHNFRPHKSCSPNRSRHQPARDSVIV